MILKKLNLKNIRSYVDEVIIFPQGSIMLSGDIGCGKSSILLAIEFAIFGVKRGDVSASSLLRNGEKEGFVELFFEINGLNVIVKRILKRIKDSIKQEAGYIVVNGVKEDLTPVELKSKMYNILGYPANILSKSKDYIFRYTVFTPQEEMKQILQEKPEVRLDTLRRTFNIEKYKKIRENCSMYAREVKSKISELKGSISDLEIKKSDLESRQKEILILDEKKKPFDEQIIKLQEEIVVVEKDLKEKELELKQFENIKREIAVLENSLNEKVSLILKNSEKIKEIETFVRVNEEKANLIQIKEFDVSEGVLSEEVDELSLKINENSTKIDHLTSNIQRLNKNIVEANDSSIDFGPKIIELKNKLSEMDIELEKKDSLIIDKNKLNKKILELKSDIAGLIIKKKEKFELKEKINSLEDCPLCLQSVDHDHKTKIVSASSIEIEKADKLIKEKNNLLIEFENELNDISKQVDKLINLDKEFVRLNSEIKLLENKKIEIERKKEVMIQNLKEKEILVKELEKLKLFDLDKEKENLNLKRKILFELRENQKNIVNKENLMQRVKEKKKEIVIFNDEIKQIKKEIGEINKKKISYSEDLKRFTVVEQDFLKIKSKFETLKLKEREIEKNIISLEKEKEGISKICEMLLLEIKSKEESKKEIVKLNSYLSWLDEYFVKVVSLIEKNVMIKIYREFNEYFIRWLGFMIEDENITSRLDESFTPIITQNGYEIDFSDLSGGERQSVALAYRLALNKVLNDMIQDIQTKDLIILDEPTDGFSSDQLDKIRDILDELTIKQVIIVSHEAKIESFVDNVIRISKDEHVSKVLQS